MTILYILIKFDTNVEVPKVTIFINQKCRTWLDRFREPRRSSMQKLETLWRLEFVACTFTAAC